MSGAKHTPGPWSVDHDHPNPVIVTDDLYIAEVMDDCWDESRAGAGDPDAEQRANASLIAAAPDLLAACEATIAAFESCQLYDKCPLGLLKSAVAKAKGATP